MSFLTNICKGKAAGGAPAPSYVNTKSVIFDGVDEYMTAPDDASLTITDNLSISMWIKGDASETTLQEWVLSKGLGSDNTRAYEIGKKGSAVNSGKSIHMYANMTGGTPFDRLNYYSTGDVFDGTWHHFVATWNTADVATTGGFNFYIDGAADTPIVSDSSGTPGAINAGAGVFRIGTRDTTQKHGDFTINQLEIWDTGKLTATDAAALYNSGVPIDPTTITPTGTAVLVSWWAFGDDASDAVNTTIYDQTANNNDFTTFGNMEIGDLVVDSP